MVGEREDTLTDRWIGRLKNNPVIATAIVAAVVSGAIYSFWTELRNFHGDFFKVPVELVRMNLSMDSDGFFHEEQMSCQWDGREYPTFLPPPESKASRPISFDFLFTNKSGDDAIFTRANVIVIAAETVSGGSPGIIEPNHEYVVDLEHRVGRQSFPFKRAYKLPGNDTGEFTLTFKPATKGIGMCWILRVEFETNLGEVTTKNFSFVTSNF